MTSLPPFPPLTVPPGHLTPPPPQAVLQHYYPKALMSELALYTHLALVDLAAAFPNKPLIEVQAGCVCVR
jgi:hypothetical protein